MGMYRKAFAGGVFGKSLIFVVVLSFDACDVRRLVATSSVDGVNQLWKECFLALAREGERERERGKVVAAVIVISRPSDNRKSIVPRALLF